MFGIRLFKRREDPVAGDVYRERKGRDPFTGPARAHVIQVHKGWVMYIIEFPEKDRPTMRDRAPFRKFLKTFPIKEPRNG